MDRGKQGVKRSLLTEAAGIPLGIAVAGTNRHDVTLVEATVASIPVERPAAEEEHPQGMRMDKAYDSDPVRTFLAELGFTPHIRSRGEEAKDISENGIKARRWVVERTHSWLNRFRRLLIRWEKKSENYLAMLHLAFAIICFRSAGLFGYSKPPMG